MDIVDLIAPHQIVGRLRAVNKTQLLRELARRSGAATGIEAQAILDALTAREALGSTGVGQGIAMPHARIAGLKMFYSLFARLDQPIDFAAIDDQKVDLVFLLLSPPAIDNDHLAALACVSRRLRDRALAARLRSTKDDVALYQILTGASTERLANTAGQRGTPRINK
jgi:nitrogen PTS system EIIA component